MFLLKKNTAVNISTAVINTQATKTKRSVYFPFFQVWTAANAVFSNTERHTFQKHWEQDEDPFFSSSILKSCVWIRSDSIWAGRDSLGGGMEREMNVCLVHSYAREQNEKIRDQAQLPTLYFWYLLIWCMKFSIAVSHSRTVQCCYSNHFLVIGIP